jgi:hypothetical protein
MMISSMRLASHIMTSRVFERYFIETESQDTLSGKFRSDAVSVITAIVLTPNKRLLQTITLCRTLLYHPPSFTKDVYLPSQG